MANKSFKPATVKASETDKAYAAAIIDGEGCIMWGGSRLEVRVAMSKSDVVEWLASHFGGNVNVYQHHDGYGEMFSWHLYCGSCEDFLTQIQPYTILKKEQVKVGAALSATYGQRGGVRPALQDEEAWNRNLMYRLRLAELLSELNPKRSRPEITSLVQEDK